MSYQEKRTIASLISGVLVLAAYCIYALSQYQANPAVLDDLKFWAITMLVFIGIGVAATIVIQIIFHILLAISIAVKERDDKKVGKTMEACTAEDEMDKLIELKSSKVSFVIAGIGFVAGLVSIVLDFAPAVMLNIVFISCSFGSLLEGFVSLYYYRKGVKNA